MVPPAGSSAPPANTRQGDRGRSARVTSAVRWHDRRDMSRARPLLAVRRSASAPAPAERIGWGLLALLACVLAHETVYHLVYPDRGAYRDAMRVMGHDGWFMGLVAVVLAATVALVVLAAAQLRRLRAEAASTPALDADEASALRTYLGLVAATWLRLASLAVVVFTTQENLEAFVAGLPLRGLDVVLDHGLLPLLVIVGATLLMSLAVALVRWRRRVLLGRIAGAVATWDRASGRRSRPRVALSAITRLVVGARTSRAPPHAVSPLAL